VTHRHTVGRSVPPAGRMPQESSADIPPLTGLRFIGAGWVAVYHFQARIYEAWPSTKVLKGFLSGGGNGVPLFFLLSGFIIWHNYSGTAVLDARGFASFLWRRFARLWPVNFLMQALCIPILWIVVHHFHYWNLPVPSWYSVHGWLANAFMVGQVGHSTASYQWDQPTWSLTGEMLAYLAFPLMAIVFAGARRFGARIDRPLVWFVLAIATIFAIGNPSLVAVDWPRKLVMLFAGGVMLRRTGRPSVWVQQILLPAVQVAAPMLVVISCYRQDQRWVAVLLALWVYSLAYSEGFASWLLSTRPALVAGKASYSLYMFHWLVFTSSDLYLVEHPELRHGHIGLYTGACLVAALVGGYLIWRFFEEKSRRRLNMLFDRAWPRTRPLRDFEPVHVLVSAAQEA